LRRYISKEQKIEETRRFFQKVYGWMFLGLIISGLTAYITYLNPVIYRFILFNFYIFLGLLFLEVAFVFGLVFLYKRISPNTAIFLFLIYSFVTGLTLSVIFLVYTIDSISLTFFIAASMFGLMSIYGFYTKTDLTGIGHVLIMGLFGIVIASFSNLFLMNEELDYVVSFVGVIVFTGLTAYDTQKIKKRNIFGNEGTPEDIKESIIGALDLYLDFVNLFLKLLRFTGKKR